MKTVGFVTNQKNCDRIIVAAKYIADTTDTQLEIVGILNNEYELNPQAVEYLFSRTKEHGGIMHLICRDDKTNVMEDIIGEYTCRNVVTGMPSSNSSVLYDLWKRFPDKGFHTVDLAGTIVEVSVPASVQAN